MTDLAEASVKISPTLAEFAEELKAELDAAMEGAGEPTVKVGLTQEKFDADAADLEGKKEGIETPVDIEVQLTQDEYDASAAETEASKEGLETPVVIPILGTTEGLDEAELQAASQKASMAEPGVPAQAEKEAESPLAGSAQTIPVTTSGTSEAETELKSLKQDADELGKEKPVIEPQVQSGEAESALTELKALTKQISEAKATIKAQVNLSGAQQSLQGLQNTLSGIAGGSIKAETALKELGTAGEEAGESGGEAIGALAPVLVTVGVALFPILTSLASLVTIIPAVFGGLTLGAIGAFAAIEPLLQPIEDLMTITKTAAKTTQAMGMASMQAGAQSAQAAQQIVMAQEGVATAIQQAADDQITAAQSIAAAQHSLDTAVQTQSNNSITAAESVANAYYTLSQAQINGTISVRAANQQLAQSERALSTAEYQEKEAQIALTLARITAADTLKSLNDQVNDGALAIKSAQNSAAEALHTLNLAKGTTHMTQLAMQQDQIAYQQAVQQVTDLQDQQTVLKTKLARAAKEGVTGSTQVVQAQHAVKVATQGVATAQKNIFNSTVALKEAEIQTAHAIKTAQEGLANTLRTTHQQEIKTTYAVEMAQQSLGNTLRTTSQQAVTDQHAITNAQASLSEAMSSATLGAVQSKQAMQQSSGALSTYTQAFDQLAPAGQGFLNFFKTTLMPLWTKLKKSAQGAFLPIIEKALTALLPLFTHLEPLISVAAEGIAQFFGKWASFDASKTGMAQINKIVNEGITFLTQMGTIVGMIGEAWQTMGSEAGPILTSLLSNLRTLAKAYLNFAKSPAFQQFITTIVTNAPAITKFFETLMDMFMELAPILFTAGMMIIKTLTALIFGVTVFFEKLHSLGLALRDIADVAKSAFHELEKAVQDVWKFIDEHLLRPLQKLPEEVGKVITKIVSFFTGLGSEIWGAISGIFDTITNAFKGLTSWVDNHVIKPVVGFFKKLPGDILHVLTSIITTIWSGLKLAGMWVYTHVIMPVFNYFKNLPAQIVTGLGNIVTTIWHGLLTAATWVYTHVIMPVVTFYKKLPGDIVKALGDIVTTIWHALLNSAAWMHTNVYLPVLHFFKGLPGDIASGIGKFFTTAFHILTTVMTWLNTHVWGPITRFFGGIPGKIANIAKGMWDGVANAFIVAINWIIHLWDTFKVPKIHIPVLGTVGGWGLPHIPSIPTISGVPHLATGGFVTAPTLAVIGENGNEFVLPQKGIANTIGDAIHPLMASLSNNLGGSHSSLSTLFSGGVTPANANGDRSPTIIYNPQYLIPVTPGAKMTTQMRSELQAMFETHDQQLIRVLAQRGGVA